MCAVSMRKERGKRRQGSKHRPESIWYRQRGAITSFRISLVQGWGGKTAAHAQLATGMKVQFTALEEPVIFNIYVFAVIYEFINV